MGFAAQTAEFFLSGLFPSKCAVCAAYIGNPAGGGSENPVLGKNLCPPCEKGFIFLPEKDVCSLCGNLLAQGTGGAGAVCGACVSTDRFFSSARSVVLFSGSGASAAKRFKYGGDFSLGKFFADIVLTSFPAQLGEFDCVAPIPLHPKRLKEREFNQSAVVSSAVSAELGKEHMPFVIERVKDTVPQASFQRKNDRKRNVRGAFKVAEGAKNVIKGARVLVFDDIFTTGATVDECSKALLSAGAREVSALTVFRTPI